MTNRSYNDPILSPLLALGVLFDRPPSGQPNMPGIIFVNDAPTQIQTPTGARVDFPGGGGGGGGTTFTEITASGAIDLSTLVDGEVRLIHLNGNITGVTFPTVPDGTAFKARVCVEAVGGDRDVVDMLGGNSAFDYSGANTTVPQDFFGMVDYTFTPNTIFNAYTNPTGNQPAIP